MILISVNKASINFGWGNIFSDVSFDIQDGERIALVGKNGCGKSTIFRTIMNEEHLSSGECARSKNCTIGYFRQIEDFPELMTVNDVMQEAFPELMSIKKEMSALEIEMGSEGCDYEKILPRYSRLQERFESEGGYSIDTKIEKQLNAFGISTDILSQKIMTLSGGERTLLLLARSMMHSPELLLLDEPTNHLDLEAVEWLEKFLEQYKGAVLLISHDRYFLDKIAGKIIEINNMGGSDIYFGNYSTYVVKKQEKMIRDYQEYENQQKEIESMKKSIATLKDWGNRGGNLGLHRRAESIQRKLDKVERIERPIEDRQISADFYSTDRSGKDVLIVKDLVKKFDGYPVLNGICFQMRYGEKVGFLGANGSGKSTFIKIILGIIQQDSGELQLGSNIKIGYIPQELNCFQEENSILQNFMEDFVGSETAARNILAQFLFSQDDVHKCVKSLSGGERVRLRLCQLMQRDINLLILDEPTNHLDILSRETIERAILNFEGSALIVSHDRYFLNKTVSRIIEMQHGFCKEFFGNYSDYLAKRNENEL